MNAYDKAIAKAMKQQYPAGQNSPGKPAQRQQQALSDGRSNLEAKFDNRLDCYPDIPKPIGYRGTFKDQFKPFWDREIRVDRYFGDPFAEGRGVIVEVTGIGHGKVNWSDRSNSRFDKDWERHNLLTAAGYIVLYVTGYMLDNDPDAFFNLLRAVLKKESDNAG